MLLSRESDGCAIFWTNPLTYVMQISKFFGCFFIYNSYPINLLLVRSYLADIIFVKCLIQGRNNATRVRVEPRSRNCDHMVVGKQLFNSLVVVLPNPFRGMRGPEGVLTLQALIQSASLATESRIQIKG